MKKVTISVLFILLAATSLHAQFRLGAKGGVNLSNMSMEMQSVEFDIYKPRTGFHAGLMAEYMFSHHFGLHTELMYFNSGANFDSDEFTKATGTPDGIKKEGHVNMNTFQMPLYLKTKFKLTDNIKFYAMGGAFASYSPEANMHIRISAEGESVKLKWSLFDQQIQIMDDSGDNEDVQHRFNAGVAFETGIEMNQFVVGVGFRQVLNNMSAIHYIGLGEPTIKMWTANLSVGYYF